ncbi:hypothetical protein KSD_37160 [Ktedonobacter sp. SOSP1-85]|nr:hypothetical protein KSD_37160 [Ktedonobacter sp. SOSP1-85]
MHMQEQECRANVWNPVQGTVATQAYPGVRRVRSIDLVPFEGEATQNSDEYVWEGAWEAPEHIDEFAVSGIHVQSEPLHQEAIDWIYEASPAAEISRITTQKLPRQRGQTTGMTPIILEAKSTQSAATQVEQHVPTMSKHEQPVKGRRIFLWLLSLLVLGIVGIIVCGYLLAAIGNGTL